MESKEGYEVQRTNKNPVDNLIVYLLLLVVGTLKLISNLLRRSKNG